VSRLVKGLPRRLGRYAGRSFLALGEGPRELFYRNFSVFSDERQRDLLAGDGPSALAGDPYRVGLEAYAEAPGGMPERMSYADLQTYLVELLMKQDQMSMAASIESRVPYLDHEFVEHVAAMPARFKLRGWRTKAVLRTALQDVVPREILTRRKMGFPVPVGSWLRGAFWPVVEEFVLGPRARRRGLLQPAAVRRMAEAHRAGAEEHGDRLWLLVNLEIWQRVCLDGEDIGDVARAM
jgi:asparagine synthase (glutamine-hydrolysing)